MPQAILRALAAIALFIGHVLLKALSFVFSAIHALFVGPEAWERDYPNARGAENRDKESK